MALDILGCFGGEISEIINKFKWHTIICMPLYVIKICTAIYIWLWCPIIQSKYGSCKSNENSMLCIDHLHWFNTRCALTCKQECLPVINKHLKPPNSFKGRFLKFRRYHNFANLFSELSETTFYKEISKFQ